MKAKERIQAYQELADYKLMTRIPLIISLNGKNFAKASQLATKPFDQVIDNALNETMLKMAAEIDGTVFAYHSSDEILIVCRNDQSAATQPYLSNKIQKLCSQVSAIASCYCSKELSRGGANFLGDAILLASVFTVPTIAEAINVILTHQQCTLFDSVTFACFYELLNNHDKNKTKDLMANLSLDDKISLLKEECGIDYSDYPSAFRRGTAAYKIPQVVDDTVRNVWTLNDELPIMSSTTDFIENVFRQGHDIFRKKD